MHKKNQKLAFRNNADLSMFFSLLSLLMFKLSFLSLSVVLSISLFFPYLSLFSFCFLFISDFYIYLFLDRTPLRVGTDRLSRNVG